uniref:Uncharacterized protein n=1 Tax=Entomoneis paludosa TaxID=265537 RepID=A0A6U3A0H8_9STRA
MATLRPFSSSLVPLCGRVRTVTGKNAVGAGTRRTLHIHNAARISPLPRSSALGLQRFPTMPHARRGMASQPQSTAIPHGIIFCLLSFPACLYAAYTTQYGPSEEDLKAQIQAKYGDEMDSERENFNRQKKMIQRAILQPNSMDHVNRELLKGGKENQTAMTRMFEKSVGIERPEKTEEEEEDDWVEPVKKVKKVKRKVRKYKPEKEPAEETKAVEPETPEPGKIGWFGRIRRWVRL